MHGEGETNGHVGGKGEGTRSYAWQGVKWVRHVYFRHANGSETRAGPRERRKKKLFGPT